MSLLHALAAGGLAVGSPIAGMHSGPPAGRGSSTHGYRGTWHGRCCNRFNEHSGAHWACPSLGCLCAHAGRCGALPPPSLGPAGRPPHLIPTPLPPSSSQPTHLIPSHCHPCLPLQCTVSCSDLYPGCSACSLASTCQFASDCGVCTACGTDQQLVNKTCYLSAASCASKSKNCALCALSGACLQCQAGYALSSGGKVSRVAIPGPPSGPPAPRMGGRGGWGSGAEAAGVVVIMGESGGSG